MTNTSFKKYNIYREGIDLPLKPWSQIPQIHLKQEIKNKLKWTRKVNSINP